LLQDLTASITEDFVKHILDRSFLFNLKGAGILNQSNPSMLSKVLILSKMFQKDSSEFIEDTETLFEDSGAVLNEMREITLEDSSEEISTLHGVWELCDGPLNQLQR